MATRDDLRGFFFEARRLAERAADLKTETAALRDAATKKGFDWSQIKALAAADAADEEAGDHRRVEKLISKADFACAYADMLGLRQDERKQEIRSSSKPAVPLASAAAPVIAKAASQSDDLNDIPGFLRRTQAETTVA